MLIEHGNHYVLTTGAGDPRKLIRVTHMLGERGIADYTGIPRELREKAMYRGKWVAAVIAEALKENDIGSYLADAPEDYRAPVRAALQFCSDAKFQPLLIEQVVFSTIYGFAGRLDLCGKFGDCHLSVRHKFAIVDFKVNTAQCAAQVQTALYKIALTECGTAIGYEHWAEDHVRLGVELSSSTGKPKCRFYDDREDMQVAMSALAVTRWIERNR